MLDSAKLPDLTRQSVRVR